MLFRSSLAGLPNEAVVATLQTGLISEGELHSLLHLIRSPDVSFSHSHAFYSANMLPVSLLESSLSSVLFSDQYFVQIPSRC